MGHVIKDKTEYYKIWYHKKTVKNNEGKNKIK